MATVRIDRLPYPPHRELGQRHYFQIVYLYPGEKEHSATADSYSTYDEAKAVALSRGDVIIE